MEFGLALQALDAGSRVARRGWNGKNMWLFYVAADQYTLEREAVANGKVGDYQNLPWIAMKTAKDEVVPWLASQADMLADDWWELGSDPG